MPLSSAQLCVAETSKALLVLLKRHGFRRRSPHLFRESGDLYHTVGFQCSQWGTRSQGRFTINLGVTNVSLYETWTGRPFPKNPGSASWPVCQRIGFVLGEYDKWWDAEADTDFAALGQSVAQECGDAILEFFKPYGSMDQLEAMLHAAQRYGDVPGVFPAQLPLLIAIIQTTKGNVAAAHKLIQAALGEHRGTPFCKTIETIAARLGYGRI